MTVLAVILGVMLVAAVIITIMSMTGKPGPLLHVAVLLLAIVIAIAVGGKIVVGAG